MYEARLDMATCIIFMKLNLWIIFIVLDMVMFLIVLVGFLFFGWLTFGSDLSEFNGFINSLGTLWQFLIGNPPDYDQLTLSNRILGPLVLLTSSKI